MSENFLNNTAIAVDNKEAGLNIRFAPDFTTGEYQLFEIEDNDLLEKILSNKEVPHIKNFKPDDEVDIQNYKPYAALCTSNETFKIKKAENTNKMYVLDLPSAEHKGSELKTETSLWI